MIPLVVENTMRNHDYARVIEVIETTILRRGSGEDENSPIRIIKQYWSFQGDLLAEFDPHERQTKEIAK